MTWLWSLRVPRVTCTTQELATHQLWFMAMDLSRSEFFAYGIMWYLDCISYNTHYSLNFCCWLLKYLVLTNFVIVMFFIFLVRFPGLELNLLSLFSGYAFYLFLFCLQSEFNRLTNYLVDSWVPKHGCLVCNEHKFSLESFKVHCTVTVYSFAL